MTDFLTKLAERALGVAPVAQPVIAPLFAPGPAIPASGPPSLDIDEVHEAPINGLPIRSSPSVVASGVGLHGRPRTHSPHAPLGETLTPLATGDHTGRAQPQMSKLLPSQQRVQITHIIDSSAKSLEHSSDEIGNLSNLVNEPGRPAAIANDPLSPKEGIPIEEEQVNEVIANSARDKSLRQQPVNTLVDKQTLKSIKQPVSTLIDKQATTLETYEHHLITPPTEHSGETRTLPLAQPGSTLPASVRIEYVSPPSEPYIESPQTLIHEVTGIRQVQGIEPQPQDSSIYEAHKKPVQRLPETVPISKRDSSQISDQGLLVPHKPGRPVWQEQQSISHQQTTDLTISYKRESAFPGKQNITVVEQHNERATEEHPGGVTGATPSMPTIRVTIGRIDVRAVTSSESTTRSKPTRAVPQISLEDYARQNKRGGR